MSSDVLFVLFDASNVGLFQECSSLLKRIFIFFIDKNRSDFFKRFSINLIFFFIKKQIWYIYIYLFYIQFKNQFFTLLQKALVLLNKTDLIFLHPKLSFYLYQNGYDFFMNQIKIFFFHFLFFIHKRQIWFIFLKGRGHIHK